MKKQAEPEVCIWRWFESARLDSIPILKSRIIEQMAQRG